MSDTPRTYDWLGPARDCLKDRGLDDAADALARLPTVEERLERAMALMESVAARVYMWTNHVDVRATHDAMVAILAEHRGETTEATLARLGPARQPATSERGPHADLPRIDRAAHMAAGADFGSPGTMAGDHLEPGLTYFRCCGVTRLAGLICPLCHDEGGERLYGG